MTEVLGATADENLAMIGDSVAFCAAAGREVVYDAEHFFDGFKADRAYALATLRAAYAAGATSLVLCDTNGGCLTDEFGAIVRDVIALRSTSAVTWGIHVHDDAGLAVANSLAAVQAGVRHVQGTVNGYGERCGNANIVTILADLALKAGMETVPVRRGPARPRRPVALRGRDREPRARRPPALRRPERLRPQGRRARRGDRARPSAYQHVDPELVGNQTRLVVSELGGRVNTQWRAEELGHRLEGVVTRAS